MPQPQTPDLVREGIEFYRRVPLLNPREMFGRLEKLGYRGQMVARRAVSLMAYRHVKRVKKIYVEGVGRDVLPTKINALLMGPTGCGKTHLVELLFGQVLKIPTVVVDITGFSETGYVGDDVRTILTRLLGAAQGNPVVASGGIVCLDEFDKLASSQNNARFDGQGTTKDVSGFGVQKELLRMMESTEVQVPMDFNNTMYSPKVSLHTADIAFIACGAFSGFKTTAGRGRGRTVGFIGKGGPRVTEAIAVHLEESEIADIEAFQRHGFLPELMGRFTRIVALEPLDSATMKDILKHQVLSRFTREFHDEGLTLHVEEAVLDHVVGDALKRQTGARGLVSLLTHHLEECAYEAFGGGRGEVRLAIVGGRIQAKVR